MNKHKRWDTKELVRRLILVLDSYEKAISLFSANENEKNTAAPSVTTLPQQVVADAFLLLHFTQNVAHGFKELKERVALLALHLLPAVRNEKVLSGDFLNDNIAAHYMQAHIFLTRLGLPDTRFDVILRRILIPSISGKNDSVGFKALENEWLKKQWTGQEPSSNLFKELYAENSLSKNLNFFTVDSETINHFSNTLLYLTDFENTNWLYPGRRIVLLETSELLLSICLDREDFDMAAMILLAWPLIGKSWSAAAIFAFNLLTERVDNKMHSSTVNTDENFLHSLYSMGMLYASCLKPGRSPLKYKEPINIRKGAASLLTQLVDFPGEPSATATWLTAFNKLDDEERDALSGFLLNLLVVKAVQHRQFGKISQLLNLGHVLGVANNRLAIQAAEYLTMINNLAGSKR